MVSVRFQRPKRSARCRFYRPRLEWLEYRLPPAGFANAIPLNDTGQVLTGTLGAGHANDYSLSVTQGTYLIATAVPQGSTGFEPRLILYDATGQLLIESDQHTPGLAGATVQQHLQPGTYYLEVSAASSSLAVAGKEAYQLTTAVSTSLPPFALLPVAPVGSTGGGFKIADLRGNGVEDIVAGGSGAVSALLGNGDGTFQPAQYYPVPGDYAAVLAVMDLRGNGIEDIVATSLQSNNINHQIVSVLLGNGDGTFQPAKSFNLLTGSQPAALADLRGDGIEDLVTVNSQANAVAVLLGNGDGTFQPAQTILVGKGPASVTVADLGNGHPDILTVNSKVNTVSVLLGNGDGTFQAARSLANITRVDAVADLGNGRPDIVADDGKGTVSVLLGDGGGTFQPAQSYPVESGGLAQVVVADVNGDGRPDILAATFKGASNTLSVLLGNGDGTFQSARLVANTTGVAAVTDLGNGHADIITVPGNGTVSVFLGHGDGTFRPGPSYFVGGAFVASLTVVDLGNGHPDIITELQGSNPRSVEVLLGNGDGTFWAIPSPLGVDAGANSVAVADLGNGHPDIVTSNWWFDSAVSVLLGNGDGTFQPAQSYPVGSGPQEVVVADVNGDGRPDIVTVNAGTVSVLLGNGDGTFEPAQTFPAPGAEYSLAIGDLGNGHPDIVTINPSTQGEPGTVSVLLGHGDGIFQPPKYYQTGDAPDWVALADLRGDGIEDIVTSDGYGTVSVLLGNGDGTFQPARSFAAGSYPTAVAVADLNGDGIPDIVTANYGNGVSVLLGNGDGTFQAPRAFGAGSNSFGVALADLRGNGIEDIVTNPYLGVNTVLLSTVAVYLGNGDGTFQPPQSVPVAANGYTLARADINGDGRPDILTPDVFTGTVSVLLNQGNGQFAPPVGPTGTPGRDVPELQDFNGDGIPDAESLDQRTGQILFRRGTGDPNNPYAPLTVVNPGVPATDFTLVQTQSQLEIAALDTADQQVVLYAWSNSTGQFQAISAFATGPHPFCIAGADLVGNGMGDIVVGNDFDNTLTIAVQRSPGTLDTFTRNVGAGPSSITFPDVNGDGLPDIVVSDLVSGDVSILFNDAGHSFTTQERFRAGQGPFDVNADPDGTTLVSQLETVGVVAGDFTGGGTDLIALNANADSFSMLRQAGGGSLTDPQFAGYAGQGAVQALVGDFIGNGRQDLAILRNLPNPIDPTQPGASQLLIYPSNGNGTFGAPIVSAAGQGATGFTFVPGVPGPTAHPRPAEFLVGDAYGDFLTLIPDSGATAGAYRVDRGNLDGEPLVVGKTFDGQNFVVLADQSQDQVQLFFQNQAAVGPQSGVSELSASVTLDSSAQTPALLAPGAVQLVDLNEDPSKNPTQDLIVASRLGNDILVYPGTGNGSFGAPECFPVGFEPTNFTVGDFNGDGGLDLAVANQGSNDVSVLLSTFNSAGVWTGFTDGPRLASGGSEPIGVQAGNFTGRQGILDLNVTNAGGQIATLPGIGSSGKGTGFFQDNSPITFNVPGTPIGPISNGLLPTTQGIFQIDLTAGTATEVFASTGLTAISVGADGEVVAGFDDGSLELLTANSSGSLAESLIFRDASLTDPSGLELVGNGSQAEIYATSAGQDRVFVFAMSEGIAVPDVSSPFVPRPPAAELQPVSETGVFLVASSVTDTGGGNQLTSSAAVESSSGIGVGGMSVSSVGVSGSASAAPFLPGAAGAAIPPGRPPDANAAHVNAYIQGVDEGIDSIRREIREQRGSPGNAPPSNDDGPQGRPEGGDDSERSPGAEVSRAHVADSALAERPLRVALAEAPSRAEVCIDEAGGQDWLPAISLAVLVAGVEPRRGGTNQPRATPWVPRAKSSDKP